MQARVFVRRKPGTKRFDVFSKETQAFVGHIRQEAENEDNFFMDPSRRFSVGVAEGRGFRMVAENVSFRVAFEVMNAHFVVSAFRRF